ncbi:MAG: hypothetical protein HYR96_09210 [Deltaproteobacteria bacterium]|nr:hypothetical protein [Deltaproteobacteria bacterium]MBI3294163.1 hypothetical protein [Deltaproteobacteria bacterium]
MIPFFYLLLFILLTSKEAVWFKGVIGTSGFNAVVGVLLAIWFLSCLVERRGATLFLRHTLLFSQTRRGAWFMAILGSLIVYLLLHELIEEDGGMALKMAAYLLFCLSLFSQSDRVKRAGFYFAWGTTIASFALLTQCLILHTFDQGNLEKFTELSNTEIDGRANEGYINPYRLGYLRKEAEVKYGPLEFNRAFGYTTESKYGSLIILAGVACLLLTVADWPLFLWISLPLHAAALFINHSYAAFGTVFIAMMIVLFRNRLFRRLAILSGIFAAVLIVLVLQKKVPLNPFVGARLEAFFNTTVNTYTWIPWDRAGLFGMGIRSPAERHYAAGLLLNLVRFGLAGVLLQITLFFLFAGQCVSSIRSSNDWKLRWGFGVVLSVTLIWQLLFTSEFLSPLFALLLSLPFLVTDAQDLRRRQALVVDPFGLFRQRPNT